MTKCAYCGCDPDVKVRGRWEVFLPLEPPSQNDVASANRGDWSRRKRYRYYRDSYTMLLTSWKNEQRIPLPAGKRRVILSRYYSGRGKRRDKGNLIGGMKSLMDAMVQAKLLVDDDERSVEDWYHQHRVDGDTGVHIVLEEL